MNNYTVAINEFHHIQERRKYFLVVDKRQVNELAKLHVLTACVICLTVVSPKALNQKFGHAVGDHGE